MTTPQWSSRPIPTATAPAASPPPGKQSSKTVAALAIAGTLAAVGIGYFVIADDSDADANGSGTTSSMAVTSSALDDDATSAPDSATTSLLPATTEVDESATTVPTTESATETAAGHDEAADDASLDSEDEASDGEGSEDEDSDGEGSEDEESDRAAGAEADQAATATVTDNTVSVEDLEDPEDHDATRRAVFAGGTLYLQGSVPNAEIATTIATKAAQVPGVREVMIDYVIDPDVELAGSAPLVVEDVVLFGYNSAELNPAYTPILDMGIALMNLNENVVITVIGHTDTDGSTASNLALAEARAAMVTQYWLDRGIPASQIDADIRGESDPVADESTPEGAAANRRVEFIITGLLQ